MKILKYKFLILIFLISSFCILPLLCQNPEWKKVDDAEKFSEYRGFKKIICNDSMNCIVWGYSQSSTWCQYFRKTTNGGETWKDIYIDSSYIIQNPISMHKIIPFNDFEYKGNTIIAVGDSGRILSSTDNGNTFSEVFLMNKKISIQTIKMLNAKISIIRGFKPGVNKAIFYESTDSGKSWTEMKVPIEFSTCILNGAPASVMYNDFKILREGLFVSHIWRNDNYTELIFTYGNWDSVKVFPQDTLNCHTYRISFINEKVGWEVGGARPDSNSFNLTNIIQHTTDGGNTWIRQRDTMFVGFAVNGIDAYDSKFAIATTGTGYVLMTHNGGRTWVEEQVDSIPNGWYCTARFPQITSYSSAYVILTSPSFIYKYTRDWSKPVDTSTVSVRNEEILKNEYNIYPNPVKEKFSISDFSEGKIEFEIYDNLGIKRLEGKVFNEIYVEFLPKGIYFLKLNKNNKVIKFIKE